MVARWTLYASIQHSGASFRKFSGKTVLTTIDGRCVAPSSGKTSGTRGGAKFRCVGANKTFGATFAVLELAFVTEFARTLATRLYVLAGGAFFAGFASVVSGWHEFT
jgi:hypothetical protein